jgi:phage-related protein
VPLIKAFADAFKAAADFLAPIITTIKDTVGGFLTWLHDAFQGFYDWLVGKSLWQDMWGAIGKVAMDAVEGLLSNLGTSLFEPLQKGFKATVDSLTGIFDGIRDAITEPLGAVVDKVNEQFPALSKTISAGTDILKKDWVSGLQKLADVVPDVFTTVTSAMDKALKGIGGTVTSATSGWLSTFQTFLDTLVGHSVWPDMLNEMVGQTHAAMSDLQGAFAQGLTGPGVGVISTIQSAAAPITASPQIVAPTQQITLPIHVYLDGNEIATIIERRQVDTLVRDATRSKRA